MSLAAFNTYKGKIERGTSSLAQIDAAERGKLITSAEATQLRAYWHNVYDVTALAAAAGEDRTQLVTWSAPTLNVGPVIEVRRIVEGAGRTVNLATTERRAVFAGDVGDGETVVAFEVTVVVVGNGYRGPTSSASVTVAAVPPPPDPEPVPDATTPDPTPPETTRETTSEPEPTLDPTAAPEPTPATGG